MTPQKLLDSFVRSIAKGDVVGVGVDLEEVSRFRLRRLDSNNRFYRRLFSAAEIRYCQRFADPAPHFAARFCAKEALVKAAQSILSILVTDCEIRNGKNGAPAFRSRSKRKEIAHFLKSYRVHLSLSHADDFGLAFVVVARKGK